MNTQMESASLAGRQLYHAIWQNVANLFYDADRLAETDWASKEHAYDERIVDDQSALAFAAEALKTLDDKYTRLVPQDEYVEHAKERDDPEDSSVFSLVMPGNIGYIRIMSFSQTNIVEQVARAAEDIKSCVAFIVDVRNNGGGLIDDTANCLEMFVASGTITAIERRTKAGIKRRVIGFREDAYIILENEDGVDKEPDLYMRRAPILAGKPTVLLFNSRTASSAELFASAIMENGKENGLCIAMGNKTAGKGIAQSTIVVLEGRANVKVTFARFFSATLEWLGDHGQRVANGVKPDQVVDDSVEENASLTAAFKYLKSQLSLAAA